MKRRRSRSIEVFIEVPNLNNTKPRTFFYLKHFLFLQTLNPYNQFFYSFIPPKPIYSFIFYYGITLVGKGSVKNGSIGFWKEAMNI